MRQDRRSSKSKEQEFSSEVFARMMKKEISLVVAIGVIVGVLVILGAIVWLNSSRQPEPPAGLPPAGPMIPAPGSPAPPPPGGTQ